MLSVPPCADAGRLGCITTSPKQQQLLHVIPSWNPCPPPPHKGRQHFAFRLLAPESETSAEGLQGDRITEEQGRCNTTTVTDCMKEPLHAVLCTNTNSLSSRPSRGPGNSPVTSTMAGHGPCALARLLQEAPAHLAPQTCPHSLGFTSDWVPLPQKGKRHHRHGENYNSKERKHYNSHSPKQHTREAAHPRAEQGSPTEHTVLVETAGLCPTAQTQVQQPPHSPA